MLTLGCGIRVGEVHGTVTIHGEPAPEGLPLSVCLEQTRGEALGSVLASTVLAASAPLAMSIHWLTRCIKAGMPL